MHPFTFRSEDDHRYWLSDPTPSLGPLYPPHYNTYHGAPTASGAKQPHPRAPLNQLEAFKPIRFTEEYANAAPSPAKSQQQRQQQRSRTRQLSSIASNEGLTGEDQVGGV